MAISKKNALNSIKEFLGKPCVFDCMGKVWNHVPATLPVTFFNPEDLMDYLIEEYNDEMLEGMKSINYDGEWTNKDLLPVAIVGGREPWDGETFGYLFFELSSGKVITTETDYWSLDNKPYTIEGLIKEMKIRLA